MFFFRSNSEQARLRFAVFCLGYGVVGQTSHKNTDFFLLWPGFSQKNAFLTRAKKKEFLLHCVFHEFILIVAIPEMTPETRIL